MAAARSSGPPGRRSQATRLRSSEAVAEGGNEVWPTRVGDQALPSGGRTLSSALSVGCVEAIGAFLGTRRAGPTKPVQPVGFSDRHLDAAADGIVRSSCIAAIGCAPAARSVRAAASVSVARQPGLAPLCVLCRDGALHRH